MTKRLIGDCIHRGHEIARICDQLAAGHFPDSVPKHLAQAIKNIIALICRHLLDDAALPQDPTSQAAYVRNLHRLINLLAEPLRFVDGASSNKVPWSLVYPLQKLSQKIAPEVTLLIRPMWSFNYSILLYDLRDILLHSSKYIDADEVHGALQNLKNKIHVISFPFTDRKSVLLHSVFAHEIGHLVLNRLIEADLEAIPDDLRQSIIKEVSQDPEVPPLWKSNEIIRRLEEIGEYRKRALEEIGSDLVGIRIMGPAALLAYFQMSQGDEPDLHPVPENDRYPPWRYRIKWSYEYLKELGFLDEPLLTTTTTPNNLAYITALKNQFGLIELYCQSAQRPHGDSATDKAYVWFERSLDRLKREIAVACEGQKEIADTGAFLRDICELARLRLAEDLPPNRSTDYNFGDPPTSAEKIINSAWIFSLAKIPALPNEDSGIENYCKARDQLDRLVLRALELSCLQEDYNSGGLR